MYINNVYRYIYCLRVMLYTAIIITLLVLLYCVLQLLNHIYLLFNKIISYLYYMYLSITFKYHVDNHRNLGCRNSNKRKHGTLTISKFRNRFEIRIFVNLDTKRRFWVRDEFKSLKISTSENL